MSRRRFVTVDNGLRMNLGNLASIRRDAMFGYNSGPVYYYAYNYIRWNSQNLDIKQSTIDSLNNTFPNNKVNWIYNDVSGGTVEHSVLAIENYQFVNFNNAHMTIFNTDYYFSLILLIDHFIYTSLSDEDDEDDYVDIYYYPINNVS